MIRALAVRPVGQTAAGTAQGIGRGIQSAVQPMQNMEMMAGSHRDIDPGDMLKALSATGLGSVSMMPENALAAAGKYSGKNAIFAKDYVQRAIKNEWLPKGHTAQEIADNINYRYSPDTSATRDQVSSYLGKLRRSGDYPKPGSKYNTAEPIPQSLSPEAQQAIVEQSKSNFRSKINSIQAQSQNPYSKGIDWGPNNPIPSTQGKVSYDQLKNFLQRSNVPIVSEKHIRGTDYLKYQSPYGPTTPGSGNAVPTIRFPSDEHIGYPPSPQHVGNLMDMGTMPSNKFGKSNLETTTNVSGEHVSDPDVAKDILKYRTSSAPPGENWLIPPDRAPWPRPQRPTPQQPGTPDPNQLDLFHMLQAIKGSQ
jgi:hypothetical protein